MEGNAENPKRRERKGKEAKEEEGIR